MTSYRCSHRRELNESSGAPRCASCGDGPSSPDSEAFGALKLTDTARGVLKGETEVMLREETPGSRLRAIRTKSRRGDIAPVPAQRTRPAIRPCSARCGMALAGGAHARRAGLCGAARFHHRRHRRLAPDDAGATARHPRIGDKKLEHYGDELLALVKAVAA